MKKLIIISATATLVFLILSISFFLVLFDKGIYDRSFSKYGAYEKVGVAGIRYTTDDLLAYLVSEDSDIRKTNLQVFTEKEQSHLKDVHWIIRIVKYLTVLSLIATFLIVWFKRKDKIFFIKTAKYTGYAGISIIILLVLLGLNFSWFFEIFHKIFFPQGNYTFQATSLLIIMFPQEFFRDFGIKVLVHSIALFGLIYVLGTKINWKKASKKK